MSWKPLVTPELKGKYHALITLKGTIAPPSWILYFKSGEVIVWISDNPIPSESNEIPESLEAVTTGVVSNILKQKTSQSYAPCTALLRGLKQMENNNDLSNH